MENIEEPKIQYIKALVNAQKKFKPVQKTSTNPFFKSKYAPYEEVWESVGEPLNENGIAVSHKTVFEGDKFCLVTRLQHISGYEESSIHIIQSDKNDTMQSKGSAETYAKRYNLVALTGVPIVNEDDDGEEDRKQKQEDEPLLPYQSKELESIIGEDMELKSRLLAYYGKKTKKTAESISDFSQNDFKWIKELIETQKKSVKK